MTAEVRCSILKRVLTTSPAASRLTPLRIGSFPRNLVLSGYGLLISSFNLSAAAPSNVNPATRAFTGKVKERAIGVQPGKARCGEGTHSYSKLSQRAGHKPIIGLSGGIGAGKSEVARILAALGAAVIDSDRMAHEELQHPEVLAELRRWWGDKILSADGRADRRAVARIVFENPAELARLEGLIYPRLQRRRAAMIAELERDPAVVAVVLDAPKLHEAGLDQACDALIFVEADRETRLRRVAATRGWSDAELARRENLQIPLDVKRANADYVIANHADRDDLRPEVERILSAILDSRND